MRLFTVFLMCCGFGLQARADLKIDEMAAALAQKAVEQGTLKSVDPVDLKWIERTIAEPVGGRKYLELLAKKKGWNSSGGGGGRACFASAAEAASALDKTGRLKREMIPHITSLVPFDYFYLRNNDFDLQVNGMNGVEPTFHPFLKDESVDAYVQRNVGQTFAPVAPLFAETMLAVLQTLNFNNWQAVRTTGLPYFPDLSEAPADAVQYKSVVMGEGRSLEPCVYVQLAIRYAGVFSMRDKPVHIMYDADLIERMRALSSSQDGFNKMLAVLVLHESLYFVVRRSSPYNAVGVTDLIKDALLNQFDAESFIYRFFPRGRNLARFMSMALGEDYDVLLLEDAKRDPHLQPRETLFIAWFKHVRDSEVPEWERNKTGDTSISFFGWSGLEYARLVELLTKPAARASLTPPDAMAAALVTLTLNGAIPSPEAVFARSRSQDDDVKKACDYFGDFTDGKLLTHVKNMTQADDPYQDFVSSAEGERDLLKLIQKFCHWSTEIGRTEDKISPWL